MTTTQIILTILAAAAATVLTRALPFFAFPEDRPAPRYIRFLGNALPGAIFGLLVVYCLRSVNVLTGRMAYPKRSVFSLPAGSTFGGRTCSSPSLQAPRSIWCS